MILLIKLWQTISNWRMIQIASFKVFVNSNSYLIKHNNYCLYVCVPTCKIRFCLFFVVCVSVRTCGTCLSTKERQREVY